MPAADFFARFGLYVDPEFASPELCRNIVCQVKEAEARPATIYRIGETRVLDERVRRTLATRVPGPERETMKERLKAILPKLQAHFGLPLKGFEEPQVLRYRQGDFFTPHRDSPDHEDVPEALKQRRISVTVCLNSAAETATEETYPGGALVFYGLMNDPRAADCGFPLQGKAGLLVAFRAETMHEVKEVRGGERYSMVTWFY
jgi:SM-20-related protein